MLSGEDRSVIEALHHAWLAAEVEGNGDSALLQLCTTTPVWLPPNQAPVCGRTAILRWLEAQAPVVVRGIHIDDLAISGIGSFASKLATFRTTIEGPSDGGPRVVSGSHGWLLQRDDAAWRIGVVAWTISESAVA